MNDLYFEKTDSGLRKYLNIADFCDMEQFEQMMKDWAESTGLATVAVGRNGEYISGCYNFTDFCYELTRKSPEGLRRCIECDRTGVGTYLCHAGLVDFAAPITLEDGTLLGNIVGGQVLPEKPDKNRFRATARELGIDEDAYIKELDKVNVRSRAEIRASANLLANVINFFVRASYAAYRDADSLNRRARIISSLGKIYFCDYFIDLASRQITELDADDELKMFAKGRDDAAGLLREACLKYAEAEYVDDLLTFTELDSLADRLHRRHSVSFEFIGKRFGWCRAVFIAVDHHADGTVSQVIFAVQRIQEEKEKELKTRQALKETAEQANAANKAKTEFLSRMSHDMRTPLNGIIGMTYLASEENNTARTKDCLDKIAMSSKFMLGLINDILDMSKASNEMIEFHPEPYTENELTNYIGAVIRPLVSEKNQTIDLNIDLPDGFVPVQDKLRINQIIFNILSNAVKFTPEGGKIECCFKGDMDSNDQMRLHIEISDNGIGMSEEFQKTVFEPFSQENRNDVSFARGTGLGMAITKRLVELMGGAISVKSIQGEGSTFAIDLTADIVSSDSEDLLNADAVHAETENMAFLHGKHVLLCEDHPLNQEIVKTLLEKEEMTVHIADDGQTGLTAFSESRTDYFDCILMDVRMPVLNGIEAASCIRALDRADAKTVPIIALTADAFDEDVKKCLDAGMNGHIAKPVDPETLYLTISAYIK